MPVIPSVGHDDVHSESEVFATRLPALRRSRKIDPAPELATGLVVGLPVSMALWLVIGMAFRALSN